MKDATRNRRLKWPEKPTAECKACGCRPMMMRNDHGPVAKHGVNYIHLYLQGPWLCPKCGSKTLNLVLI